MGSHDQKRHSKVDSVIWETPAHVRENIHGDFLDRMYIRTHASGWADFVELELENWPNVPNQIRQQLTKAVQLVRRLYLHSYALDDALAAEARACRAAMSSATERAARIMELELEIARLQNVPMRYFCHICETSTPNTQTGHCSDCGSERLNMRTKRT